MFEENYLMRAMLALAVLSFLANGIHYLFRLKCGSIRFFYIQQDGALGKIYIVLTAVIVIAVVLSFFTDKKISAFFVLLYFTCLNVIALVLRRKK